MTYHFTRALLLAYVFVLVELRVRRQTKQYLEPRCGQHGFVCMGPKRVRLCSLKDLTMGAAFLCPRGLQCDEQWAEMCINDAAPWVPDAKIRCRRGKRVPNHSVPNCKGYIMCMPVDHLIRAIHLTCNGDTIFNARTGICSAPDTYRCPAGGQQEAALPLIPGEPVFCLDYKQRASAEQNDFAVQYFCPKTSPADGPLLCTVHTANFCLTLERYDDVDLLRHTPRRRRLSTPAHLTPSRAISTTYVPSLASQAVPVLRARSRPVTEGATPPPSPVTRPAITVPVTRPAIAMPVTRPAIAVPVTRPAITVPVTRPAIAVRVTRPAIAVRVTRPAIAVPVTRPAITVPELHVQIISRLHPRLI